MIFSVYGHPLHDRFRIEGASIDPGAGIPGPAQLHWRRFERRQWRLVLRNVAFMSPLLTGPEIENFVVWLIEGEDGHRVGRVSLKVPTVPRVSPSGTPSPAWVFQLPDFR